MASRITAIISTGRRPIRSASRPNAKAPISMPTKNIVPVCKAVGTGMPNVEAMEGAVNPIDRTCIASASQTRPKMPNSRYWNRPTPAARMPCSIVMVEDVDARALDWGGALIVASGIVVAAIEEIDDDILSTCLYRLVLEFGSPRTALRRNMVATPS
ncbi:hypothetical protein D9M72_526640 [compost metagenome]